MFFSRSMIIAACVLQASQLVAKTDNQSNQRQCSVINGVIECVSQLVISPEERGQSLYNHSGNQHGPLLGYGSPGYKDSQSRFTAIITDDQGREKHREVRVKYLETSASGNKRLLVFDKPLDLKRHALLTVSSPDKRDEHWAYNPDNEQVKRLLSNNAATPFSGSEFNFEDLSSQDLEKYEYRFERNDNLDGIPIRVVSRFPKDKNSAYERLETWIDAQTFLIQKIDYYDRKGKLLKTLTASDYQLYADKYWRANQIIIENHQTGKSTQMLWSNYQFDTGLTEKDFSLTSLRNVN